ncbi:MAG: hypothetical protein JOS17DRAFT_781233 [Linnemannia elongata]|nr:MAG: hypothetical protein JOS17DRAFT_781233 [Linnemannia elongata]
MATLSPASPSAAEALLHRARRLSHNAYNEYERSRPTLTPSIPTAFAEGEELIFPSSSSTLTPSSPSTSISLSKLPSPSLSPTSCLTTASLHQKHRESFNGIVREHGRKRSSAQRNSSASTASTSSSASTYPTKTSSPASSLSSDPSTSPVTMVITPSSSGVLKEGQEQEQQAGQGPRGDQGNQEQDQRQQVEGEGAEGRQQEQPQPLTSSVALSSSLDDASVNTNTTTASSAYASTSTPTSSLLCPTITQTTTTTTTTPTATTTITDQPPMTNSHSLTIVTRPRALTLESIRELRESMSDHPLSPPATSTTLAPMDHHRKHKSELGHNASLGLVRGVMEALRDNEQQSQQQAIHARTRSTPGWALSLPETAASGATPTPTPTPTTAFLPQADLDVKMMMNKDQVITTPASLSEQQNTASPILPATPTSTSIHGIHPMAHYLQVPEAIDTTALADLTLTSPPPPPQKSAHDRAFTGTSPPTSSPLRRSSMTPSSSSDTHDEAISKGAVLSSSPPTPAPAAGVAAITAASSAAAKSGRRSSKLFGKLVPKFLQTSFGPNNPSGGNGSSPRSAVPVSPSPLSAMARPARSASFTSGPTATAVVATGAASGSVGMICKSKDSALPQLPELPDLQASVLSSNEDWLGLNGGASGKGRRTPSPVLSASPITTIPLESAQQPPAAVTSQFNMSIVAIEEREESLHSSHSSTHEFRTYDHEPERPLPTMPQEDFSYQKQQGHPFHMYNNNNNLNNGNEDEDDYQKDEAGSPYIIDENCDDDFFLNSVLRKKSSTSRDSTSPSSPSSRPQPPPLLSTGSWRGATPSLSATSSSSQASSMAPSPTSPYPSSSSMYTPTPTPVSTTTATPLPYRINGSTAQTIQSGLDEKRTRLRDAVGEWRRSANASMNSSSSLDIESTPSPVIVSTYSGFAL